MKKINALKLTCVGAFVATLGVGCASTGYAQYDADQTDADQGVGVSASADVGTDRSIEANASSDTSTTYRTDLRDQLATVDEADEGEARVTVSALSMTPETRAQWVNKFPFYDQGWQLRTIQTYTFAVTDPSVEVSANTRSDAPEFSASLPPGSVFVEAAGGAGEVRTGRVIQHSPNPTR